MLFRLFSPPAVLLIVLLMALLSGGCSDGSDSPPGAVNPFGAFASAQYADLGNWLCHPELPDVDNACAQNMDTTVVFADGSTAIEPHVRAPDPEVDCFYVYPTVSADPGGNADLDQGPEEIFTTLNQAGRYSRFCRMFAPVYRQGTIASIFDDSLDRDRELAYGDVLDSFKHYMANYNSGRGVILVGHSQGSGVLARLLREVIETDEFLYDKLVAAHLIGATLRRPEGADVGATFARTPVCRASDQVGCVVSYASYRVGDPFLAAGEEVFGSPGDGELAICVNPAAPAGGAATMSPYFPADTGNLLVTSVIIPRADGPFADSANAPPITTPFFSMPDFIVAECAINGAGVNHLQVMAMADPSDPRADDFNGEFIGGNGWGLHLVDVTIGMGDLVALGAIQATAWLQERD